MAKKPAKKAKPSKPAKKTTAAARKPAPVTAAGKPLAKVRNASRPKNSNTNAYTLSEVIENIRAFCGMPKRSQAKELCEDIALFLKDSLRRGYKIPFLGLGKLYVRQTKPRIGRNPKTGEMMQIPARKRVRFTPTKALKEAVL